MMLVKVKKSLDRALEAILLTILSALVVIVLWQVCSRYLLASPSTFTDEVARFLLIWLAILGAAWVLGQRAHLAIDLLPEKMSSKGSFTLHRFIYALIILFATGVMVVGGINLVLVTLKLEQLSTVLQIPMGLIYLVLPISGLCMLVYGCCHIFTSDEHLAKVD